jgi:NTP pyrophosphatase (non-canonical NTP hydrolase)
MKITRDNVGNLPLDEFLTTVAGIYSKQDEKRSIYDIWLHATHHAASIGEEVRKFKPGEELFKEIADFAMWLFTFVGKINVPLGSASNPHGIEESTVRICDKIKFPDILWNKYPGLCPVCFWRRFQETGGTEDVHPDPCDCLLHEVETRNKDQEKQQIEKLYEYACSHKHDKDKLKSVDDWQKMFEDVYKANLRHIGLEDIAFHLLEEVGEVSNAVVRSYTYVGGELKAGEPYWRRRFLESEIADAASWMFTLVNCLELVPEIAREFQKFVFGETVLREEKITLSRIIWKRYAWPRNSWHCPHVCQLPECECPINLVNNGDILKTLMACNKES